MDSCGHSNQRGRCPPEVFRRQHVQAGVVFQLDPPTEQSGVRGWGLAAESPRGAQSPIGLPLMKDLFRRRT